jgi:hypothetical protein
MKPRSVYDSDKEQFHLFEYTKFRTNLNSLKKSVRSEGQQINFDDNTVRHEAAKFPRKEVTSKGLPFYDTSEARKALVADVSSGKAELYQGHPRDLRKTNNEYAKFPPIIFAKHVHREKQKVIEKVGWQNRRNVEGSRNKHGKNGHNK